MSTQPPCKDCSHALTCSYRHGKNCETNNYYSFDAFKKNKYQWINRKNKEIDNEFARVKKLETPYCDNCKRYLRCQENDIKNCEEYEYRDYEPVDEEHKKQMSEYCSNCASFFKCTPAQREVCFNEPPIVVEKTLMSSEDRRKND